MIDPSRDRVVAVIAQSARGPGWANKPLWVIVKDWNGKLREECLQPEEQPEDCQFLYRIAEQVHLTMVGAVENHFTKKR